MEIISRTRWGARHPNGFRDRRLPATQAWLHHSVTIAPDVVPPFDDDYAAIRAIEAVGQQRFGGGISYTRLITPAGLIFEGHGIGREGSHTAGRNSIAVGYCLVGNYDTARPTDAQLRAVAWCLQHDHARGWLDAPQLDGGHRDLKATACPGRHAYAAIGRINALAAGGPITEEDDVSAAEVLHTKFKRQGSALGGETDLAAVIANYDRGQELARAQVAALSGKVDGLINAVAQLAGDRDVDLDEVRQAAEDGTRRALAEGTVRVDIDVTGPEAADQ